MSDLIDRQAAIDTLRKWDAVPDYNEAEHHIMRAVMAMLEDMPSAEPKNGKYLPTDDPKWAQCSECGNFTRVIKKYRTPNYCPACGARMDKE